MDMYLINKTTFNVIKFCWSYISFLFFLSYRSLNARAHNALNAPLHFNQLALILRFTSSLIS